VQGTTSMHTEIHNNNKLYLLNGKGTLYISSFEDIFIFVYFFFICMFDGDVAFLISFPNLMTVDYSHCVIYYYYSSPGYCVTFQLQYSCLSRVPTRKCRVTNIKPKIIYLFAVKLIIRYNVILNYIVRIV